MRVDISGFISGFKNSKFLMWHGVKAQPWKGQEKRFALADHSQSCKV
jgi:hypothetical protein